MKVNYSILYSLTNICLYSCLLFFLCCIFTTSINLNFIDFITLSWFYSNTMYKIVIFLLFISISLPGCSIFKRSDIKDNPVNVQDRVDKNIAEGRGLRFGKFGNKGGGTFDFASSNPMWQASMELLDFVTLANASYSGGIIITDWFNDDSVKENIRDIKITIKFLSNEIRSDGLQINVHERICKKNMPSSCAINKVDSKISTELKFAILQKAARLEKNIISKTVKKNNKQWRPRRDGQKGKK